MSTSIAYSFEAPFAVDSRASYRHWTMIPIRFSDQDALGHVNNAAIATYFEQARVEALEPLLCAHAPADVDIVLARILIDYHAELAYPGTVDVGLRVARVGNKSVQLASATFLGETCHASAIATIVFFNTRERKSVEIPENLRERLPQI
mgnify:CR=1 FL=1